MGTVDDDLSAVLSQALTFVRASRHEGWTQRRSNDQIADWLVAMIDAQQVDPSAIRLAFAPTGELQELAMANGWTDEDSSLSSRADELLGYA